MDKYEFSAELCNLVKTGSHYCAAQVYGLEKFAERILCGNMSEIESGKINESLYSDITKRGDFFFMPAGGFLADFDSLDDKQKHDALISLTAKINHEILETVRNEIIGNMNREIVLQICNTLVKLDSGLRLCGPYLTICGNGYTGLHLRNAWNALHDGEEIELNPDYLAN